MTPSATSERLQGGTPEVVTEVSCEKKAKTDDSPCVDTHTHKTSCELAASPEHSRHGCESEWRSETSACHLDSLMEVGSLGAAQVRTSEHTDAPPQCDGSPKVSSALDVNLHQQTSSAGPHSGTLVENSFDDIEDTVCGNHATSTVSSVPIPDQQAGMVLGQTYDTVPHQCSTGTGACREDDCREMMFESHEDHLLDELFGLPEANSSLRNDGMAEDLLCGLCPEDLSFTLNASVCQDFAREDGFTSPQYSLVKSPNSETLSMFMKQGSGISTPAAMCGEDATVGGSAATVPVSELRSTGLKEESVVPLGVNKDGVSQVGGGGGERRGGLGDGGGRVRTEGEGGAGSGRGGGGGVEEVGKRRERTEGGGGGGGRRRRRGGHTALLPC